MWRLAGLLLVSPSAFAMSPQLSAMLPGVAADAALLAGGVLVANAAITGVKMLMLNFFQAEQIGDIESFEKFSPVPAPIDWSSMTTHIDFHAEAPTGGELLPDIDPALLSGFDDIDFMVFDDLAEDQMQ